MTNKGFRAFKLIECESPRKCGVPGCKSEHATFRVEIQTHSDTATLEYGLCSSHYQTVRRQDVLTNSVWASVVGELIKKRRPFVDRESVVIAIISDSGQRVRAL